MQHREGRLVLGDVDGHCVLFGRRYLGRVCCHRVELAQLEHCAPERPPKVYREICRHAVAMIIGREGFSAPVGTPNGRLRHTPPALRDRAHTASHLHRPIPHDLADEIYRVLGIRLHEICEHRADTRRRVTSQHAVVIEDGAKILRHESSIILVEQRKDQLSGLSRGTRGRDERPQIEENVVELRLHWLRDVQRAEGACEPRLDFAWVLRECGMHLGGSGGRVIE